MGTLYPFGINLILSLQTLSPALDGIMKTLSAIGRPEFFLVLLPFIYWTIDRRLGIRTVLVLFLFDFINASVKVLFHQPRPYWLGNVRAMATEDSYGIPSGHSGRTLAVGAYLAIHIRKNWFWALAVIYTLLVGLSRLYLGVHFPQDVLGGWVLGIVVVWAATRWEGPVRGWLVTKSLSTQVGLSFLAAVGVVLTGYIVRFIVAGSPDPAAWSAYNAEARSMAQFFTIAGAVFGALAGYALMRRYARFNPGGRWILRLIRYVFGLVFLLLLFSGMDALFAALAPDESAAGYILRFTRYGLVTLWVTFLAPWLFLKTKLAEAE
jgi:membrane-associated phospholipid phosphatase